MSSRSSTSISKALAVLALLFLWVGTADAGRKRVCVLDFEGPNADKFHEDLVKLLKKNHTVVSVDKWNKKAEELDAGKVTEKNVKKVAKKLKVDGVITGKIEKRRDEYIIRLKLRSGTTGEILGNSVQTKADGPRLDGQAQRDIKEELVGAIDELESNREGGDDEEEEAPKGKGGDEEGSHKSGFSRKKDEESDGESATAKVEKAAEEKRKKEEEKKAEEEAKKAEEKKKKDDDKKKKKDDDEEKEALATKKDKDEGSEEEERPKKHKKDDDGDEKPHKRKASKDDGEEEGGDEEGVEESAEVETDHELNISPSRRAIDAALGLSFTARRLTFKYSADLGKPPPAYKQAVPVPGAYIDMTFYPLSFSHKPAGIVSGLGLEILYDQVLVINSQKKYPDQMGNLVTASLATKESRYGVGAVLRYPLGTGPRAIVVGGKLSYAKQQFTVAQTLPNNDPTDVPNVSYSILSPAAFIQAPVIPKVTLNAQLAFLAVTDTGDIQKPAQYGAATVTGYQINVGGDYMIMPSVFVRAEIRYESFGFTFKGDPMSMTNTRDTDPDQDVQGAKDTYFGGAATVGYVY
ncbi:MAG TPA: hypothetical protein VLB44_25345 [Kofleriaceae bacterium]|nr:hypothetical protein [Kofleriaceae bacterium]